MELKILDRWQQVGLNVVVTARPSRRIPPFPSDRISLQGYPSPCASLQKRQAADGEQPPCPQPYQHLKAYHLRQPSDIGKLFLFAGEEEEIAFLCGKFFVLYGLLAAAAWRRRLISKDNLSAATAYPSREEKRASKSETLIHCFT